MKLFHPSTESEIRARNKLLQKSLRPEPLPFSIDQEYPTVLNHKVTNRSYCAAKNNEIVAHANLWLRYLLDEEKNKLCKIGLIGNVATDEKWRGQGLMYGVFDGIKKEANRLGLDALILWSDLQEFYQKLGFRSLGEELRFILQKSRLAKLSMGPKRFYPTTVDALSDEQLEYLLVCRYPVPRTLERSAAEFRTLLDIPMTRLYLSSETPDCYGVIGKGYDMAGVVHEWGAGSPEDLIVLLRDILDDWQLSEIMLLAPGCLRPSWRRALESSSSASERHPMTLCWWNESKKTNQSVIDMEQSFIWGLDSI